MANYIIARIENYKMGDIGKVGKEQEREKEYIEKYYQNPDYDPSKTKDNVTLAHDQERDGKTWEKYIKEYRTDHAVQGRFNVNGGDPKTQTNIATQFMVTASKEYLESMDKSEQVRFFKDAFKSLKEQYPTYHWAEVTIHYDEQTPHMHAMALPLYYDPQKDRTVFSTTKTQAGKEHFREFQDRLHHDMTARFGYNLERGVRGSDREHLSVKEYKDLQDREKALQRAKEEFEREKEQYKRPPLQKTVLGSKYKREDVERVIEERNQAYAEIDRLRAENRDLKQEVFRERDNAIKWEKSARGEHEERLHLQDRLQDRDYLQNRVRELERNERAEPSHNRDYQPHGR